ncbi:transcription-repair-coupling factor [bacterium BMS3Abin10]|nr:transcription-repair-coupling factor [bacterium BMS3Abin10]GBE38390.1 transcription-repair-coupling factor [bacterium BMS3Bbin08]
MPIDLSFFEKAARAVEHGKIRSYTSLSGSSKALFFSMVKGPCLLLCSAEAAAGELYSDAVFWSKALGSDEPVLIPPEGDPLRLANLRRLYSGKIAFIASVEAALSPIWPGDKFPLLKVMNRSAADRDSVISTLESYGYLQVPLVSGPGEMSIRGGILDVFPPEQELPVRMEFFGDEIESLRVFDTDTQRTVKKLEDVSIGPAVEPDQGPNLIDVLDRSTLILNEPDDIKRQFPDLSAMLQDKEPFYITSLPLKGEGFDLNIRSTAGFGLLQEERRSLEDFIKRVGELWKLYFILMVCSSEGQAKRLKELFSEAELEVPVLSGAAAVSHPRSPVIAIGKAGRGFVCQNSIVLAERDIFGKKPVFKSIKRSRVSRLISSIEDFNEGDYLVHMEHGIGKFIGLKKQAIEDHEGDFIVMEYLGGDRLYVPLERIDHVQKYHAPESVRPKMDKLGGKTWQRTRRKIRQKIKDMARKLLAIYARRTTAKGHAFSKDTELHREFDGFFLYEETPDQLTAINEIKRSMESLTPMDTLLCGDVGYGKTEVIMRACFKAVYDSKQAAVLVPTTILAEQHFDTFTSRFSAFPVKIDFISRFKNRAEQKQTLRALANGDIDIIIGTHRLLAKDVGFYDLGLLVIDEEHRFGVTHKEKIKSLRSAVDIITLSATPIPRTLHMALSGIRAMSVIETPPEDRLAVRSFVARFDPGIIEQALQKELDRDGQAFFVHNRVQDIYSVANYIRELVPGARVAVAHGQMREKELEQIMRSFFRKETNILVSTAIIGSGLDIPSANTIIIDRADKFGLADLYQLRGRVGRSNVRAYSYFLIPGDDVITAQARKKLQAIQELGYLGAGFRLALRDLEIRGAGNLLGAEQSGHILAIGFDLYVETLEQAVAELKGEKIPPRVEPVLELRTTAIIPEAYIENPDLRLSIYRKIALAKDSRDLKELVEELGDRFGTPPEETRRLLQIMELKVLAKKLAITRIQNSRGRIKILFMPEASVTPQEILKISRKRKLPVKFIPQGGFEIDLAGEKWPGIFRVLKNLLIELVP